MPSLQRRILKRPPVGETDFPRLRAWQPVDSVRMNGCKACVLAAGQEYENLRYAAPVIKLTALSSERRTPPPKRWILSCQHHSISSRATSVRSPPPTNGALRPTGRT